MKIEEDKRDTKRKREREREVTGASDRSFMGPKSAKAFLALSAPSRSLQKSERENDSVRSESVEQKEPKERRERERQREEILG